MNHSFQKTEKAQKVRKKAQGIQPLITSAWLRVVLIFQKSFCDKLFVATYKQTEYLLAKIGILSLPKQYINNRELGERVISSRLVLSIYLRVCNRIEFRV